MKRRGYRKLDQMGACGIYWKAGRVTNVINSPMTGFFRIMRVEEQKR